MEAIIFKCMCVFTMHFLMVVDKKVSGGCRFMCTCSCLCLFQVCTVVMMVAASLASDDL